MESTEQRILHYQRGIERATDNLDKPRLLHCIKALSKLPVTMKHLKSTGIGRSVNSLRKIDDGVGDASKRLVQRWKEMVSNASDSGESDEACVPDDPDNYDSVNCDQEPEECSSPTDTYTVEDNHNNISRPEALEKPALSPPMMIDVPVSPEPEPELNLSDDEEDVPEETSYNNKSSKHSSSSKDKESKKESKSVSSYKHHNSKDKKESSSSSKVSKSSKDNGHDEHKKKDKDRDRHKSKSESSSSSSSKDKKHSSDVKKRKVESSDEESNRKKQRLSVCENESDNDEEQQNNYVIDDNNDDDHVDEVEDHESLSIERDSEVRESSKDRHKNSSLKQSDNKSSSSSSSKSKEKSRSSSSSSSSKAKSSSSHESKKDKSTEERSKKDDKNKSKSSHSSSSSKETNGKDKERHSSSSKDEKEKSRSDEKDKDKVKDKKEHKKSKEHKEKKKSKKPEIDGSIDSMSGTSFADALGMFSMPPPPKKKKESSSSSSSKSIKTEQQQQSNTSSPQPSPSKSSSTKIKTEYKPSSPDADSSEDSLSLLAPNVKLEPLSGDINEEVDLASTLPEPSPYYKPLPQVNHVQRRVDEEAMLAQVINAKVQRTKVYSGNKSGWTTVPSLQEVCIRILIENIDALEYTGGVPFDILKPVLERATTDQLFMLEYHNPYLVEESDALWQFHCNKLFKNKQREEMESWREMYLRCVTEREYKLKAITANIKQSIEKSTPVRSTKMAYMNHTIKPPRNVLRQQAKYGTSRVTTSASDLKKKLITGAAGPSSSSSSSSGNSNVERITVPPPPPSRARPPTSHPIKKAKAPLMAKALQAIKGRYKR